MKKWKKSGRKRNKKTNIIKLNFTSEEYIEINKYRIEHNYSWTKLANVALKEAVKLYKENEKKCVT